MLKWAWRHNCNSSTWKTKAGGLLIQSQPRTHSEFKTSLTIKKNNNNKKDGNSLWVISQGYTRGIQTNRNIAIALSRLPKLEVKILLLKTTL